MRATWEGFEAWKSARPIVPIAVIEYEKRGRIQWIMVFSSPDLVYPQRSNFIRMDPARLDYEYGDWTLFPDEDVQKAQIFREGMMSPGLEDLPRAEILPEDIAHKVLYEWDQQLRFRDEREAEEDEAVRFNDELYPYNNLEHIRDSLLHELPRTRFQFPPDVLDRIARRQYWFRSGSIARLVYTTSSIRVGDAFPIAEELFLLLTSGRFLDDEILDIEVDAIQLSVFVNELDPSDKSSCLHGIASVFNDSNIPAVIISEAGFELEWEDLVLTFELEFTVWPDAVL